MPNAIIFYRIERWLYLYHIPILPRFFQLLIFLIYNSKITPEVKIGKGSFFVCKGVSCVLHPKAEIGENNRLGIHLTIVGQAPYFNCCKIGNHCWIGPNVTIQGPCIIEDNVIIAPGSVVTKSVPQGAIVAGNPARIIGFTNELKYDIMNCESNDQSFRPFLTDKREDKQMINLAKINRGGYMMYRLHIPFLPKVMQLIAFLCYSSAISYKVKIGKGTFFNHSGFGILINSKVVIGENCKIGNNVSIIGQGPYKNVPVLKNRVYVGPGAIIQGPVIIEDDVIIAPNAVVTKSFPHDAIVAGIPAKIIGWKKDLDYDIFKDESWKDGYKTYLKI